MNLRSIQALRAVAAVTVVVYHLSQLSLSYASGVFYDSAAVGLKMGIDLFFVISGVVMVITAYPRLEQAGTATRFAIHRLTRIYPPYWVLAALLTLYYLYNPAGVNAKNGGVDLIASFTLLPSDLLPIVPVAWTLSFELLFYFVFFLFIVFVKREFFVLALCLWAGVVLVGNGLGHVMGIKSVWYSFLFAPYIIEFILGCFIGLLCLNGYYRFYKTSIVVGLVLFAFVMFISHYLKIPESVSTWLRVVMGAPVSVFLVYGLIGAEQVGKWQPHKLLMKIGDASYSLYLTHILVLHAAYRFAFARAQGGYELVFVVLAIVVCLIVGIGYYRLVERPVSTLSRRWLERAFGIV